MALLTLYERSRDWPRAVEAAHALAGRGAGSLATRIAHYRCEQAQQAQREGRSDLASDWVGQAIEAAPSAARPRVLAGTLALEAAQPQKARPLGCAARRRPRSLCAGGPGLREGGTRRGGASPRTGRPGGGLRAEARSGCAGRPALARAGRRNGPGGRTPVATSRASWWSGCGGHRTGAAALELARGRARPPGTGRAGSGQWEPPLPLRRLRLRGAPVFLAMPGLPGVGYLSRPARLTERATRARWVMDRYGRKAPWT